MAPFLPYPAAARSRYPTPSSFIGMGINDPRGLRPYRDHAGHQLQPPGKIKPGTVGPAITADQGQDIADDGEILIKGPQVMKGYYKNPKATKEVFTKDGFFRTGDIGAIDDDGFLITGRIKDIIVTAGGKNISPQNIENSLKTSQFIEQVAVIGDRRKYLSALVIPAFDEVKKWAKHQGITLNTNKDLIENEQVKKLIGGDR